MSTDIEDCCCQCSRLIEGSMRGYDDVVSAPYVTKSGDLFCIPCGREMDKLLEHGDDWDAWDEPA